MKLLLACAGLLVLAACGRPGPPRPPGPADQVTYPRAYPPRPEGSVAPAGTPASSGAPVSLPITGPGGR